MALVPKNGVKKPSVEPAKKTHTALSPSNASRWMNCPGSVALCAQMPKPEQSVHAGEGEAAHALLEKCLKDMKLNPYDFVGSEIGEFEVDNQMAEAVAFTKDYVKTELQSGGELLIEKKVDIFPGKVRGTLDIAIIRPYHTVTVIDFKYGKGVLVPAADNPQLLLYGVPLMCEAEAGRLKCVIVQPRVESQISEWTTDAFYVDTFVKEAARKIALTEEPGAPTVAGSWCKWCWAKPICPTLRQDISATLPAIPGKDLILPDVRGLDVPTIKRILDKKDLIEDWLDACAAYAQELVEAGGMIPGYELAKKRANRKWLDEEAALRAFADLGEAAFKVKILSPKGIEDALKAKGVPNWKDRVAPLTETPDNGQTLKKIGEGK